MVTISAWARKVKDILCLFANYFVLHLRKKTTLLFLSLALVEIIFLFLYASDFVLKTKHLVVNSGILLVLALFSSGWIFALFYFMTGVFLLCDWHFMRLYGEPFKKMSQQFLLVTFDTNLGEVLSYLKLLSSYEIAVAVFLVISAIVIGFMKKRSHCLTNYLWLFFLVVGLTGGYGRLYIKQISEFKKLNVDNSRFIRTKNSFKWHAVSSENSPQNVVIFIGESHRYGEFSKMWNNYDPQHTILMTDAISQYSYTYKALPQILSRKTINDTTSLFYESSILKLFEEAGYETYFLSYLTKLHTGDDSINFITTDSMFYKQYGAWNVNYKKHHYADGTSSGFVDDMDSVLEMEKILSSNNNKKLIVIKIIGCHFSFEDRYPNSWDFIKPSQKTERKPLEFKNKKIILNTYKNAMKYSIHVIQTALEKIKEQSQSSLLVFSSDHAVNIFDKGQWGVGNVKESYHLPVFWYANDAFLKNPQNIKTWKKLAKHRKDPITTNYIPETLASLSSISYPSHNPDMDLLYYKKPLVKKRLVEWNDQSQHFYEDMD